MKQATQTKVQVSVLISLTQNSGSTGLNMKWELNVLMNSTQNSWRLTPNCFQNTWRTCRESTDATHIDGWAVIEGEGPVWGSPPLSLPWPVWGPHPCHCSDWWDSSEMLLVVIAKVDMRKEIGIRLTKTSYCRVRKGKHGKPVWQWVYRVLLKLLGMYTVPGSYWCSVLLA